MLYETNSPIACFKTVKQLFCFFQWTKLKALDIVKAYFMIADAKSTVTELRCYKDKYKGFAKVLQDPHPPLYAVVGIVLFWLQFEYFHRENCIDFVHA